jgi:hypothetical protein
MFKEDSRGVDYVTVLAGHLHNATENNYSKKKTTSSGVSVLRSGSPSGDGAWDSGNMYSSDKSHQVYIFDANRGLYSTVNIKLTREDLERGINVQGITDDTDYLRTIEKSIGIKTDDLLAEDVKKLYLANEKQIKLIEKKYERMLKRLDIVLSNPNITEEKKKEMLTILGYDEEIKPYLETRELLRSKIASRDKKLNLTK